MSHPAYTRAKATFARKAIEYGKPATLIRLDKSGPAHNPTTTPIEYPIQLLDTQYKITNRPDALVQSGDKVVMVSAAGEAPRLSDRIKIDQHTYSIIDVQPFNMGGLTVYFTVHARK